MLDLQQYLTYINSNDASETMVVKELGDFHWLHFSDLHLTPEEKFDTIMARDELKKFLRDETTAGRLTCDYIFFTGDIANKGNYDGVSGFIKI